MLRVCFSQPVGGVQAGEPVEVTPQNAPLLQQAARMGLKPMPFGEAWSQGRTRYIRSGGRTRGYCPVPS